MTWTLTTCGAWRALEKLLAMEALARAGAEQVAAAVDATCKAARGQPVYMVDSRDYWEQQLHDHRAASDMADTVNGAIAYDRDAAVDAVAKLVVGSDAVEYLRSVAACLEQKAAREGEYTAQALARLLDEIVTAVTARISRPPGSAKEM